MGRRSDARGRIVSAARRLFHERGYQAVGVAELCAAAGVNKGSFYHFFPSKRALLLHVLDDAWDETGVLTGWERHPPASPDDALRQYLQELFACHYADWEEAGRVRGSLIGNLTAELGTHDTGIARHLQQLLLRERRAFETMLAAGRRTGAPAAPDPERTADALIACLHGLLTLAKARNDLSVLPASEEALLRLAGTAS